jgi:hypothetical protein
VEKAVLQPFTIRIAHILLALAIGQCARAAHAATVNVGVNATALKALQITKVQDLDLGTITLGSGTWSNVTVSLTRAGVFTCPAGNVTCAGATRVATYNVQGSNKGTVNINTPNVTLINQNDTSQQLTMVVDSPTSVVLPNSGQPGVNFSIGGRITVSSNTSGGTYVGTFNVTADYQ